MDLVLDATETDDPSLVGEAAHIVAESPDGPRGQSPLTLDQRNSYRNLILLCNVHHKQVDDQVREFTVQKLLSMKSSHEEWVRTSLAGYSLRQQTEKEAWASIIDTWVERADLNHWLDQTWGLLQPTPGMQREYLNGLLKLRTWLLSRVWPEGFPELRLAFENFRLVLGDLVNVFQMYADSSDRDSSYISTETIYRVEPWNREHEMRMLKKFEFHVDLLEDLTCELTRAANWICDSIRATIDASFRREEGVLLVQRGMDINLRELTLRLEYSGEERQGRPYTGLKEFMEQRESRDYFMGRGYSADYFGHFTE